MNIIRETKSICPECNKVLPATVFERDGKVWIEKNCPDHGKTKELYWGSYEMYQRASKHSMRGRGIDEPYIRKEVVNCPSDCGLCKDHLTHTNLANIVVTNRCDLACWYCFFYAKRAGYIYEPSLDQIREMAKNLRNQKPVPGNAVQLTGGEPCLRDDIIEIIKIVKGEGIDHVQLNTDGIRLANDPTLARRVREAGTNTIYLSFDGLTPETNPKNHWEIASILENCKSAGMGIVFVPTVIRGMNDHEVGGMVKFAAENIEVVRGLNFQPVSLTGRLTRAERDKYRITIPDVIKRIEEQTDGEIAKDDFYPVPCTGPVSEFVEALTGRVHYELSVHFTCGAATYVFIEDDNLIPITRFVDIDGLFEYLTEKAEEIKKGKNRYWVAIKVLSKLKKFVDKEKQPKGLNLSKIIFNTLLKHNYKELGEFHHKSLFIGMMHFQDKYNYDIERVMRCGIHYLVPDGRIIPFCAFNVIPEWYRDKIQREFGIPIEEWEKITGRKIQDDFYIRGKQEVIVK
ncbi:MAG: radical SAM protein [Candidatus Methylarchaceae archaeon HK01M]|nr:radical SAM protein [Candidatus Methylarchaceae archaeon HK01M]